VAQFFLDEPALLEVARPIGQLPRAAFSRRRLNHLVRVGGTTFPSKKTPNAFPMLASFGLLLLSSIGCMPEYSLHRGIQSSGKLQVEAA
jgi:hypothetical protein